MANAASWRMQLRPVTYSGDAAEGDSSTYHRTEACGDFGPPLSKETQSDQRFTALTGTEAVKPLIGRCTCINQDWGNSGRGKMGQSRRVA